MLDRRRQVRGRQIVVVAGLAGVLIQTCQTTAQPIYSPNDFVVVEPFATETARDNFRKCYPETTDAQKNALARLTSWGYTFTPHLGCPPDSPQCDVSTTYFRLRRILSTNAPEASPPNVYAAIRANEDSSCTSPREYSNYSSNITLKQASYQFSYRARKRLCALGGSVTVAEGTGDVVTGYNIQSDFSLTPFSRVSNEQGKFLGLFKGGLAEAIVTVALGGLIGLAPAIAVAAVSHDMLSNLDPQNFAGAGIDILRDIEASPIGEIGGVGSFKIDLKTKNDESGFRASGNQVTIDIVQDGYKPTYLQSHFLAIRKTEIDFLKSLSEIGPEEYVVQKGDNLWDITKRKYGDPRLFVLIADYSSLKLRKLDVGEVLKLPRWHELCEKLKPNQLFVRYNDSLWKKAKAGQIPFDFKRVQHRSKNPNLIFPYEELVVRDSASGSTPR